MIYCFLDTIYPLINIIFIVCFIWFHLKHALLFCRCHLLLVSCHLLHVKQHCYCLFYSVDKFTAFFKLLIFYFLFHRCTMYKVVCCPFTGMNHHGQNILFGCGFLLHEDNDSFCWLFDKFLKSMGMKAPLTIMTDQDLAMAKSIPKMFPTSVHRLCTWHISVNAKKRIGHLLRKNGFSKWFYFILNCVESESEFQFFWTK